MCTLGLDELKTDSSNSSDIEKVEEVIVHETI